MKTILSISLTLLIAIALALATLLIVSEQPAFADLGDEAKKGACLGAACPTTDPEGDINSLVATVINIFSWIVGVVAVFFVILGGFKYITSGGDSNKVSSAKNTILYAIVGLIIVALAQVIVIFVLDTV